MIIFEIIFDILYLVVIWTLSLLMLSRRGHLPSEERRVPVLLAWGFCFLSLGDTGHVGFRVVAYALGGIEQHTTLVNLGGLATEITLTFLYMLILEAWRVRNERKRGPLYFLLFSAGLLRLLCLIPLVGQLHSAPTADIWFVLRNIFLIIQGLGVAVVILTDALKKHDRVFTWLSLMIFLSHLFYIPTILLIQKIPLIGFLMIPKTLAYVAMAVITFQAFFSYRVIYSRPNIDQSQGQRV